MWTIVSTQDEASWLDDYIGDVIAHAPDPLPVHDQRIGHVECIWYQTAPGLVYVAANPADGTPDDRILAEQVLAGRLFPYGYKRATYKTTGWASDKVMAKAQRLVQSGAVKVDRNSPTVVMAHVTGDGSDNDGEPDVHTVEIRREDPGSQKLTGMFCDCNWGQFMNTPRTRQWKQFQYTPCAHVIATYWVSSSVPTDESRAPGNDPDQGGQMSLFDQSGGQAPGSMGLMRQQMPQQMPGAPQGQQMDMGGGMGGPPPPESVLPQFPMDPSLMPQVNPASTPGGRPGPTPTNPLQYPGGTFSRVLAAQQYNNGDMVRLKQDTLGQYEGRPESGMAGQAVTIQPDDGEVRGTDPTTGMVQVLFTGKQFETMGELEPFGASAWCWPSELEPSPVAPPGPAMRRI